MNARGVDFTGIAYLTVIGVTAFIGWQIYKKGSAVLPSVTQAVSDAVAAVNPANPNNVVNRGVTAVVQAATGTPNTLGTWLAEKFDSTTIAADAAVASVSTPNAIQLWTVADQEDAEAGLFGQGAPIVSPFDTEDADLGQYLMGSNTAGGAVLNYRLKK